MPKGEEEWRKEKVLGGTGESKVLFCTQHAYWRRKWQSPPVSLPGKFHGQELMQEPGRL